MPPDEATPTPDTTRLSREAYSELVGYYHSITDALREIRTRCQRLVLLGELDFAAQGAETLPRGAPPFSLAPLCQESGILDVGCGNGDNLCIMRSLGFTALSGIDIAPEMARSATRNAGVPVRCGDFRDLPAPCADVIFAQALVHLFPKAELPAILRKLVGLARRRVYFSTTMHTQGAEGIEAKEHVTRYRSRYTQDELLFALSGVLADLRGWRCLYFFLEDCFGKRWINVVLDAG